MATNSLESGADHPSKAEVARWSNPDLAVALKFLAMERGASGERGSAHVVLEAANRLAAAPDLLAILDELEGSFDQQTYAELSREELDPPDDREYSVNITVKQLRAITAAISKAQSSPNGSK